MAVEDKYVDANVVAGRLAEPALVNGAECLSVIATFDVAAADDDGSVYRVFKDVSSGFYLYELSVSNDAITGGTDYDLGLYKTGLGAVVDKDKFADGFSMASARGVSAGWNAGMFSLDVAELNKTLGELSGQTDIDGTYDIALTANTVGSAAGTITVRATFLK